MLKHIAASLLAGASLSGCIATPPLREMAVDTNRLVADTANDQTMLNILRAKDRLPMHFTSFTALRGNLSVSGTAGLGLSMPPDGLNQTLDALGVVTTSTRTRGGTTATPSLSATVAANPNFDLAVYDSKEFENGILTPVPDSLIEYYLQDGWPEDLLTALFVSRIVITITGETEPIPIENRPEDQRMGEFVKTVRMVSRIDTASVKPLIPLSQFGKNLSLADLDKLDGKKFDVEVANGEPYVVRKKGQARGIGFEQLGPAVAALVRSQPPHEGDDRREKLTTALVGLACSKDEGVREQKSPEFFSATLNCKNSAGEVSKVIGVDIYLRSPEAILYFLGAYVRCELQVPACTAYTIRDKASVIKIERGWSRSALFNVQHRGASYMMPEPSYTNGVPDHRGSQAVVLVQQLVNLQKSADTLPLSSSIHLVP